MNSHQTFNRRTLILISLPATSLFILVALTGINTPGVYMDAVNPDYMAVRLYQDF